MCEIGLVPVRPSPNPIRYRTSPTSIRERNRVSRAEEGGGDVLTSPGCSPTVALMAGGVAESMAVYGDSGDKRRRGGSCTGSDEAQFRGGTAVGRAR